MTSMVVFDVGDTAYYPEYSNANGRPMTVIDREFMPWRKSNRIFVRYLFGTELMDYLVEDMQSNVKNEYDNLVVIQGHEGSGKSQLAFQLCKRLDPKFDFETSYVYDYNEFLDNITNTDIDDRGRVFWMDEATNVASNREFMQNDNRKFIQLLEMMRSRGWTLIMCIPSVERLDVYIRDHRIRYLLTTVEKSWDEVYTERSRGFYELQFKRGDSYKTFYTIGYGTFGVMTPEERKAYDKIKRKSQEAKMNEIARKDNNTLRGKNKRMTERQEVLLAALREQGVDFDTLANLTGLEKESVKTMSYNGTKKMKKLLGGEDGNDEGKD